jgi:hypothetical protein
MKPVFSEDLRSGATRRTTILLVAARSVRPPWRRWAVRGVHAIAVHSSHA